MSSAELWMTDDGTQFFLIPAGCDLNSGQLRITTLQGSSRWIDPKGLSAFEITEDQARRIAKDQLGETLEELKQGIDDKLADLRRQLDEKNRAPVTEDTTVTPNATPALFDLLKKLPGVIGNSLSGEENRVDAAKTAMADLQRQLKDAGIDLDEHLTNFPDRLSGLRKDFEEQRAASNPATNEAPSEKK